MVLKEGVLASFNIGSVTDDSYNLNNIIAKHINTGSYLKELSSSKDKLNVSHLRSMIKEGISFWVKLLNETPYFKKDCVLVNISLLYTNEELTFYINKDEFNQFVTTSTDEIYKIS